MLTRQPISAPASRSANLLTFGIGHAIVDAVSLTLVAQQQSNFAAAAIAYNIMAFGGQVGIGYLSDVVQKPKLFAGAGCCLLAVLSLLPTSPLCLAVLVGVGNALFHIGGGTVALSVTPGKAAAPGIFVAFGALGLFLGGLNVKMQFAGSELMALCLMSVAIAVASVRSPVVNYTRSPANVGAAALLCVLLLNITILVRAVSGFHYGVPPGAPLWAAGAMALAVFSGKAGGGVLADRWGWKTIGVGAILCSIPLLAASSESYVALLIGVLFANVSMAITLVATSNALPGRPGFSFGLACGSILMGYGLFRSFFIPDWAFLGLVLFSAMTLYFGLKVIQIGPKTARL